MVSEDATRHDMLIQRVAHRYFVLGANQHEIAASENLSRSSIQRLLIEAKDRGVVQIRIGPPVDRNRNLEIELRAAAKGLAQCVITRTKPRSLYEQGNRLGYVAARHIERTLGGVRQIGIAASRALWPVVSSLRPYQLADLTVVDLLGCPPRSDATDDDRAHVGEYFAQQLGARFVSLPSSFVSKHVADRDAAMNNPKVAHALMMGSSSEVAVTGLGSMLRFDGTAIYSPVSSAELDSIEGRGAVGHICGHFFDSTGRVVESELSQRLIGTTPDDLLRIPRRIVVAAGPAKVKPLAGAIHGGFATEIVTDESTATALIASL